MNLRESLQAARINRIKRRIAEHWQDASCNCPMHAAKREGISLDDWLMRFLTRGASDAPPAAVPPSTKTH